MSANDTTSGSGDTASRIATALELGTTAVAAVVAPTTPVLAAGFAVLPPVLGQVIASIGGSLRSAADARTAVWLENVAAAMHFGSIDDAAALVDESIDKPQFRDNLLESFRRYMNALSEAAVPYVARLSALYFQEQVEPDPFFRGVGQFLEHATAKEIGALLWLVGTIYSDLDAEATSIEAVRMSNEDVDSVRVVWNHVPHRGEVPHWFPLPTVPATAIARVFALLKRDGVATDNPGGYLDTFSGPNVIVLDLITLRRLHLVFG